MSTLGTLVDLLLHAPDAVGPIVRFVQRIKDARGEDRAAILANLERVGTSSHEAFARAEARLEERFPEEARAARRDEPTRPVPIPDTGEAEDPRQKG